MRRALIALITALLLAPPLVSLPAAAQLNFKDQKSVDNEIARRVDEQLKKHQPTIDRDKKAALEYQRQVESAKARSQIQPGSLTLPVPDFSCAKAGCSGEMCQPVIPGMAAPLSSGCQYLTFYGCYKTANCVKAKSPDGKSDMCRWQDTAELRNCLLSKGGTIGLTHAGLNR